MKMRLLLRGLLLVILAVTCQQVTVAQEEGNASEPDRSPRRMTNDDFFRPAPPQPAVTPQPEAVAPTKKTSKSRRKNQPEPPPPPVEETAGTAESSGDPASDAPVEAPRMRVELAVSRDANGNWILSSKPLPISTTTGKEATFSELTVSTGKAELDQMIEEAGRKHGVDPRLILEVMRQESGFRQYAVSPVGAKGLMQFMPGTAARMGIKDAFDPRQSIEGGAKYLRQLLDMFNGNVELALAGYNAGEHRVIRNGYQVPRIRETQNYVRTITAKYGKSQHVASRNVSKKKAAEAPPAPPMRIESRNGTPFLTNQ